MMVMTAKVDFKKVMLALAAVAALVLALILLLGETAAQTGAPAVSGNDGRVKFLSDFGWEVSGTPTESGRVRIPEDQGDVFRRYNTLQKDQGYDLSKFAGKTVMRYVYQVSNYPGASAPVYATLLVHKNQIIGGDVTDTSPGGHIRGFRMPAAESSVPTESTPAPSTAP